MGNGYVTNPGGGTIVGALILGLGAFLLLPALTRAVGSVGGKPSGTTPGGGHSPGGAPPPAGTGPTPGGSPPPTHTGAGTTPAGDQVTVSFWADAFEYQQGATVTLYGQVLVNGQGQAGRTVNIVDPDANPAAGGTVWLSTYTSGDGSFSIPYAGNEGGHWRSYATDQSGVVSGVLDFWPQRDATGSGSPEPPPSGWQQVYDAMSTSWANYSGLVDPYYPQDTAAFLSVWRRVQDALTSSAPIDQQLMADFGTVTNQLKADYDSIAAGLNQ